MSPLFTYKGKLLQEGGKLANNANCCCSVCPVPCDENNPCPDPFGDGRIQCINNCCTVVACCCVRGIARPDIQSEELCTALGGTFHPGQFCGTFECPPAGVCSCQMFFDRIRLLVLNCETNTVQDRTIEALDSLVINYANHDMVNNGASCNAQSCAGKGLGYHYQCQIFGGPDGITWCGDECGCDQEYANIPDPWFLPDPDPGPGCTIPANRNPLDDNGRFRNSVNITPFPTFYTLIWKDGYPDAFSGAIWYICRDFYGGIDSYVEIGCDPSYGCNCSGGCIDNPCIEPCQCVTETCVDGRSLLP
jgi:hypothetical protein